MPRKLSALSRVFLCLAVFSVPCLSARPAQADVIVPVAQAISQIERSTDIPIYLPSQLPMEQEVHLAIEATASSYRVDFNYTPDCGGTPCYFGAILAEQGGQLSPNPFTDKAPRDLGSTRETFESTQLSDGTAAQYINGCGAYCTAVLEWQSEGILYQVTVKNGSKATLLEIANSAIEAGARNDP